MAAVSLPKFRYSLTAMVAPNHKNTLVLPEIFTVDIHIEREDPRTRDHVYILLNEDGTEHQRRTLADDAVPGDDRLTLVFTGMRHGLSYTLIVEEGREGLHYAIQNLKLEDLIETAANQGAKADGPGDQPEPEEYSSLQPEDELPEMQGFSSEARSTSTWEIADRSPTEGVDDPIV
jgi:hypothetical protein